MNWSRWQVRVGAHYCPEHGPVSPKPGLVPTCPQCGRATHLGVRQGEDLTTREIAPTRCRAGHRLEPGRYRNGTTPCSCAIDGFHRTWTCACGDEQMWPPHDDSKVKPYFGPGAKTARADEG